MKRQRRRGKGFSTQFFENRCSDGRSSGIDGLPDDRQGAGADYDALAEHLADQGHFPRVCPRLRQEGERHDRRGSQDRGAAGGRRGAGLRPARRGVQGHARRRPRRDGLPLRQAECPGPVGVGPRPTAWTPTCCSPGTSTAAARSCWRSSMQSIGANVVSFLYGPMATQPLRLVQEADHARSRISRE